MIAGLVLAGGRSRRMGGVDKALLPFGGTPLVARAVGRLRPQVACLAVSMPDAAGAGLAPDVPLLADAMPGFQGPLAGMLAGLLWASRRGPAITHLATVAVDTPFFPADLVGRLAAAAGEGAAVARSGGRDHPVFALLPLALAGDLAGFLAAGRSRGVGAWLARHAPAAVDFGPSDGGDPFFNINAPEDVAAAEARLGCAAAGLGES